jgi:hypothetical protein
MPALGVLACHISWFGRCTWSLGRYHTNAWFYEIFDLGRKLVMTGLLVRLNQVQYCWSVPHSSSIWSETQPPVWLC